MHLGLKRVHLGTPLSVLESDLEVDFVSVTSYDEVAHLEVLVSAYAVVKKRQKIDDKLR